MVTEGPAAWCRDAIVRASSRESSGFLRGFFPELGCHVKEMDLAFPLVLFYAGSGGEMKENEFLGSKTTSRFCIDDIFRHVCRFRFRMCFCVDIDSTKALHVRPPDDRKGSEGVRFLLFSAQNSLND